MPRTTYYVASSLDGFIATPDHSLDWLLTRDIEEDGPMGPADFITGVGAIAMGASTYRWIRDYQDRWDYTAPTWVFTHRDLPAPVGADVRFTQQDVRTVHAEMSTAAGDRDVWLMGGGDLVGQFADAGLLDEVVIAYAPVTLGSGAPLLPRRLELRMTELARNGEFACARYDVVTDGATARLA
ncbi:dihydrofolate reductase family protein [Georgenia sp. H159]|uniref:dihydrofolate reductase family protein n=1 Tax=Georgenia sp. H159 TaxID=3076115 RepID=UPI002D787E06|nr:dihydrofolate reductase family protein [Georgenia sp. H159]